MKYSPIGCTDDTMLVCVPLIGADASALREEAAQVFAHKPDIVEWRADFFANLGDCQTVIAMAQELKDLAGTIPLIFTIRSEREGGQPISLSDADTLAVLQAICRDTDFDYVDCELSRPLPQIAMLKETAGETETKLIGSFHNFACTPPVEALVDKLAAAEQLGLDVAKIAVMPQDPSDVLVLLAATLAAKKRLAIPVITMSMGPYGSISRMAGGLFGSALTFASVEGKASAPGQVPLAELRTVLAVLNKTVYGK